MSTAISTWRKYVSPNAGGQITTVIDQYVLDTIRDFCERTRCWQVKLDSINVVAGTAGYALSTIISPAIVAIGDVVKVMKAKYNDELINPVKEEYLNEFEPEWEDETDSYPERYYVTQNQYIYLVYTPAASLSSGLDVWVAIKPLLTATTVEDFIYNEYRMAIVDGACSRLMRVSGIPKEDLKIADYFSNAYELAVARAKAKVERGLSLASLKGKATGFI